ncbi:hypothetical protein M9H77_35614 [Catharanthus roseus]|uniref:Uncharacterized protein n=1 Tax=Catharanthus roseus TaxID=4058 RepID=A0ACB9ZPI3_CATRO|nr:hypothetical protein M9H77_35614 [Catharanthus roseus]
MEQCDIIEVELDEVDDVIEAWGYSLAAFVVGGFPGFEAIKKLTNTWKVHSTFKIHKFGWLVFRFDNEKDIQEVLDNGPYLVFSRPIVMKPVTSLFEFGSASMSTLPVWVNLRGLLCDISNDNVLAKICSKIGTPLYTDAMTGSKNRISFAKVLVDVDLAKDLVLGHSTDFCKMEMDNQAAQLHRQPGSEPPEK